MEHKVGHAIATAHRRANAKLIRCFAPAGNAPSQSPPWERCSSS